MSDRDGNEHEQGQDNSPRKKRVRACDQCRKRKVRCDGSETAGKVCSNCTATRELCTYTQTERVRKMRYIDEDYVRALEAEVTRLRETVQKLQKQLDERHKTSTRSGTPSSVSCCSPPAGDNPVKPAEADSDGFLEGFKYISLEDKHRVRFLGRSSHFPLLKAAIRMKHELIKSSRGPLPGLNDDDMVFSQRRPQFWFHIADYIPPSPPYTDFPEPTLMNEFLESYFSRVHVDFPLLHCQTFLQGIASGLHLVDEGFGAVVLLVCALGARFSHNPAALPPGAGSWQLAGWQWFNLVRERRKLVPLATTTLYDVQVSALAAAYAGTLALPHTNYAVVAHGLRLAQDLGIHRRITYGPRPTVEGELRKRAFWCLIMIDRAMCTILGRPCSIQEEDFDLDYLVECDDEYWSTGNSESAFQQPSGKPSVISHFNWYLKLSHIQAHALRTIYSLQGAVDLHDSEHAQQIVADLDSELNAWADSLPPHLKYDANREDMPFAAQAASLHGAYLTLRIFVHRPFMMCPRAIPVPFPSREICTNAARACIQVLDRYFALAGPVHIYQYHMGAVFSSAIILLLNVWKNAATDPARDIAHLEKTVRVLKSLESYWDAAGRFWDILHDLTAAVEAGQRQNLNSTHSKFPAPSTAVPVTLGDGPPQTMPTNPSSSAMSPIHFDPMALNGWMGTFALGEMSPDPDFEAMFEELLPSLAMQEPQENVLLNQVTIGPGVEPPQTFGLAPPTWWGANFQGEV